MAAKEACEARNSSLILSSLSSSSITMLKDKTTEWQASVWIGAKEIVDAQGSFVYLDGSPFAFRYPSSNSGFACLFFSYDEDMQHNGAQIDAFDSFVPQVSIKSRHLDWPDKSSFGRIDGLNTGSFGAVMQGYVYVTTGGDYDFSIASDDGSWLFINDALIVDNGGRHGIVAKVGSVYLSAGYHRCRVHFFDSGGGAGLSVSYKGPDTTPTAADNLCDEYSWPDKDHGLVCGPCKVLVDRFDSTYG